MFAINGRLVFAAAIKKQMICNIEGGDAKEKHLVWRASHIMPKSLIDSVQ